MPQATVVILLAVVVFIGLRRVVEVRVRGQGERENAGLGVETDRAAVEAGRPDVAVDFGAGERTLGGRHAAASLAVNQLLEDQIAAVLENPGLHQVESGVGFARFAVNVIAFVGPGLRGEEGADGDGQCSFHGGFQR